jgi:hypothetical protein
MKLVTLTITHSAESGTVALGTSKGDGSAPILKAAGFRWSRNIDGGAWFVPQSRDRAPRTDRIDRAASGLRTAGFDVEVEIDTASRSTAQVEADRAARSADRVEHLAGKAERLTATGEAAWERTQQLRELIPLGQPMMPDHYSYNRDRNFRDKLHRKEGKAIETLKEGEDAARRADAAETNQRYRMTGPVTERRIKDLEAELRKLERDRDGYTRNFLSGSGEIYDREVHEPAAGGYRERLESRIAEVTEQLTYWRAHLEQLTADGAHRVWGPADFTKGDQVQVRGRWCDVLRVNQKSLTVLIVAHSSYSQKNTVPYDEVQGQRSATGVVDLDKSV